jgi:hypothetical protein
MPLSTVLVRTFVRLGLTISGGASYVKNVRRGKALGEQEEVAYKGFRGTKGGKKWATRVCDGSFRKRVKAR